MSEEPNFFKILSLARPQIPARASGLLTRIVFGAKIMKPKKFDLCGPNIMKDFSFLQM